MVKGRKQEPRPLKKEIKKAPVAKDIAVALPQKSIEKSVDEKSQVRLPISKIHIYDDAPLLSIKDVSKSYRGKQILSGVSFDIQYKDIFGLIGMSGSGKTTLFQMLIGFSRADSGDITVQKAALERHRKDVLPAKGAVSVFKVKNLLQKRFGFASQLPSFYEHLTVEENIAFFGSLYGMPSKLIKENREKLLELTGLTKERDVLASQLSGGMQRRLDIACALVHNPRVLLLDEPTSDLDPIIRRQIWSLIKNINDQGTTVIVSSHILEEVEHLCTKIAILHDKRILGYGSLEELKELFSDKQEVHIRSRPGDYDRIVEQLRKEKVNIESFVKQDGSLVVFLPKGEDVLQKVVRAVERSKEKVSSLDVNETTLTEIFVMLTDKKRRPDVDLPKL
jgi:ABC-2 type transport system ATP-binding protein